MTESYQSNRQISSKNILSISLKKFQIWVHFREIIYFFSLLRNLSEDLTTDKIAEIRAKLISNRRTRIKPEDEDSKAQSLALGDMEVKLKNCISKFLYSRYNLYEFHITNTQRYMNL